MKGNVISIGIGLLIGLLVGGATTWYLTRDFANQAVIEAELRFNQLLEDEKDKVAGEMAALEIAKETLKVLLTDTEYAVDSLNTAISNRNKEIARIKQERDEQISSITGMSHNELTDFFAKRYGN